MGNQLEYTAMLGCLKTFLFVFNIFFWVMGLLFMAIGFWAELNLSNYVEMSPEFSGTAPYVFIGIGMLIVTISSIAFSCIIRAQPALLFIYSGFLGCISVMCIGVIAALIFFRHTYPKTLYNALNQAVINYGDLRPTLDFAQIQMHCCGANNYTDWFRMSTQRVIPHSCCLDRNNCVTANYSDVFQKGCYEKIAELIHENMEIFAFMGAAAIGLPLFGTILSCLLANVANKSKYDVME